jgi:hypothetical protein
LPQTYCSSVPLLTSVTGCYAARARSTGSCVERASKLRAKVHPVKLAMSESQAVDACAATLAVGMAMVEAIRVMATFLSNRRPD